MTDVTERPRYADPALSMEARILAAQLAIAQVAERAGAVRDVLRDLVASAVESDRGSREKYLLTASAGEECLRRYAETLELLAESERSERPSETGPLSRTVRDYL